jgi:predicted ArsR family transcriptional regulator
MHKNIIEKKPGSYGELGQKFKVHPIMIKRHLKKLRDIRKSKKFAPKTTKRQEAVITSRLKFSSKNIFSPAIS